MTTYREFQAELERLHQQSESLRRKQKGEALERIRALIAEYHVEPADLGFTRPRSARQTPVADAAPPSGDDRSRK